MAKSPVYHVQRLDQPLNINAEWDKPAWRDVRPLKIQNPMGDAPLFTPSVQAKMMYDDNNLYVIFLVHDRYVRCVVKDFNGPVYEEPAVEFFFSPDNALPQKYFNLEINAIGTPLMHFNDHNLKEHVELKKEEMEKIHIAHSLPDLVDTEIKEPVSWTIEYKLPLSIVEIYSKIDRPSPGVSWKANFYKIAEKGTNVHFLTWSEVINAIPNFHLPKFFGTIIFQ
jgi:hypothetical protein